MSSYESKCEDKVESISAMMQAAPGTLAIFEHKSKDGTTEQWSEPVIGWASVRTHGSLKDRLGDILERWSNDVVHALVLAGIYVTTAEEYAADRGDTRFVGMVLPGVGDVRTRHDHLAKTTPSLPEGGK
jgi:hypothetical protein